MASACLAPTLPFSGSARAWAARRGDAPAASSVGDSHACCMGCTARGPSSIGFDWSLNRGCVRCMAVRDVAWSNGHHRIAPASVRLQHCCSLQLPVCPGSCAPSIPHRSDRQTSRCVLEPPRHKGRMYRIHCASMALRAARSVTPCCIWLHTEPSSIWRNVRTVLTVKIPADRADCRKAGCRLVQGELRHGCHSTVSGMSESTAEKSNRSRRRRATCHHQIRLSAVHSTHAHHRLGMTVVPMRR